MSSEKVVVVNLDNGAFDGVTIIEVLDGGVDCGQEVIGRIQCR